jgi:CzcA family heavy metal efflux pump
MKIGITSPKLSQMEMTELARWTIRPRLMAVPGVANVAIWGQRDRQFQVIVDPEKLQAHDVSLATVERAAAEAVTLEGGGFLDTPNQRLAVRQQVGVYRAEDLGDVKVDFRAGTPLCLRDVADVIESYPPPIGDAVIGVLNSDRNEPGLLLIVEKQPWGNTLEVTHKVEAALDALRPGLKDLEIDSTIFRPATFIERSLYNLSHAMAVGCALVVVILFVFLFDWRTAVISLTAIPLSLIAAGLVLHYWGGTLNTMVIAGLVIALGEVVDDAIIDVENILRRLQLNSESEKPLSSFQVVLAASLEVRSAVVYASLIVTLVFVPILFLDGLAGSFFRPLAVAYILAILASLLTALTVTPALSLLLLPSAKRTRHEAPLAHWLKAGYRRLLPPLVARPRLSLTIVLVAFLATGIAVTQLGEEFLPNFQETDFLMHWVEKPSASLDSMVRITKQAANELRSIPGVRNFGSHIGRAEVADEVYGPNFTELWISVDPKYDLPTTVKKIQTAVDGYPGIYRDLLTYLKERIKEVLSGAGATIVVRTYGPDLAVLRAKAEEIKKTMEHVDGVTNLKVEAQVLVPQVQVRLKPDAAARFGLSPAEVRHAVATLIKGTKVGEVYQDQKTFDVVVRGAESVRSDLEAICTLPIDLPLGGQTILRDVADVYIEPAPNEIKRESASRRLDVTCNVSGRDLGSVAREIESGVRQLEFPREYHPEFLGEYAARQESRRKLFMLTGLSVLGILLLLHIDFRSWRLTLLVFLTIPFALVGGVLGAIWQGGILSLGSLVGFVTVLGIAARNGIMLVSHYRHLEEVEGEPFGVNLVLRGAEERLTPILMTALATGLALVPLVIGGNLPGHEIEYPMAVVILGGLATSTILNLFLLPPIYALFGHVRRIAE